MLYATDLIGANAYDNNGDFVGRVKELFIEPADQPSRVARVLLSRGRTGRWSPATISSHRRCLAESA